MILAVQRSEAPGITQAGTSSINQAAITPRKRDEAGR
jgi:hypothetical protein